MKKQSLFQNIYQSAIGNLNSFFAKEDKKAYALPPVTAMRYGNSHVSDPIKGLKKPTNVSFDKLRAIARADAIIRICVNVIKKEVSQCEWEIVPRKGKDVNQSNVDKIEDLLLVPNGNGETLRLLLDRVLEDLLVLDAGCIEKVYNAKGELVELNSVDAATIRPVYNLYGEIDQEKAYVQVIDNKVVAQFKNNELIYMIANPQNDIKLFGYGMSPIESILLQVHASLNADLFNAQSFSKDNVPPGMIDLGDMGDEEAQQFVAMWNATVIDNTQKLKFIWGRDTAKRYTSFSQNNKDMQYMEYIDWLSRIKLATYGLSGMDANITQDVNRATAQVQEGISKSRGVKSIKRLFEEYVNREVIMAMGFRNEKFQFKEAISLDDKKKQAEIDKIYVDAGIQLPGEVAEREGFEIIELEELEEPEMSDAPNDGEDNEEPEMPEDEAMEVEEEVARSSYTPTFTNVMDVKKKTKQFRPLY